MEDHPSEQWCACVHSHHSVHRVLCCWATRTAFEGPSEACPATMHSAAPPTAGMGLSIAVFAFISTAMLWSMYVPTFRKPLLPGRQCTLVDRC